MYVYTRILSGIGLLVCWWLLALWWHNLCKTKGIFVGSFDTSERWNNLNFGCIYTIKNHRVLGFQKSYLLSEDKIMELRGRHCLSTRVTIRIPLMEIWLLRLSLSPLIGEWCSLRLQLCTGVCCYHKASHSHQWCIVFVFDILERWLISLPPRKDRCTASRRNLLDKAMQAEHWLNIDSRSNTAKKKTEKWPMVHYITALAVLKIEGCRELLRIHRLTFNFDVPRSQSRSPQLTDSTPLASWLVGMKPGESLLITVS